MNAVSPSAARVRSEPSAPPPSSTTASSRRPRTSAAAVLLERAERSLALLVEDLRDRASGATLDDVVDGDERASEPLRELRSECGLARAHEADERDVPVERGQGAFSGSMRARYAR